MTATLDDVRKAYRKRDDLAARLADQNKYIGTLVREVRATGQTWAAMAEVAGTSDVAVIMAARRSEKADAA
jgi:hypothetical protein